MTPRERIPAKWWNLQYRLETAAQEVDAAGADPMWAALFREAVQALHNKDVTIESLKSCEARDALLTPKPEEPKP